MKFTRSSLTIAVNGRTITVQGEAYLPGHGSPDFVVYSETITRWDDGAPVSQDERNEVLAQIAREAQSRGLRIELE